MSKVRKNHSEEYRFTESQNINLCCTGIVKHKSGSKRKTIVCLQQQQPSQRHNQDTRDYLILQILLQHHHRTAVLIHATATEVRNSYVDYEMMMF